MMNKQPENTNTTLFNDMQHQHHDHHFVGFQHYQQNHGDRPWDISNHAPVNAEVHKSDNGQSVASLEYNELPIKDVEVRDAEGWIDAHDLFNEQPDQEYSNDLLDDLKLGEEYFADQENQNLINPPAAHNGPMQQHQVHMQFNVKQEDPVHCVNQIDNMQSGVLSNQPLQQVNNQQFALQDSQFNNGQVVQRIGNTNRQQVAQPNFNGQFALQDGLCNNGQVVQPIGNANMQQVVERNLNGQFALQDGKFNNGQVVQQICNTNMQHLTYNMPNLNSNTQGFGVPYLDVNKEQFPAQNGNTNAQQFGAQNGYFNIPQSALQNGISTNIPNETICIKQDDGSLLLLPPAGTPYNQLQQSVSQTSNKRGRKRKAVKELKPPKPRCMIPTFKKNMLKSVDMPKNYNREIKTQIITAKEFLENKKPESSKEKETGPCETKSDITNTSMLHSNCQPENERQVLKAAERENRLDYSDATGQSPMPSLADGTIPTETYLPVLETGNKPTQENSVIPASSDASQPGLSKSFAQADTNNATMIVQTGKDLEPTRTEQNCNKTANKPTQENSVMTASADANEPGLSNSFAQADRIKDVMIVQTEKDIEPTRTEQKKKWPCEKGNCKKKGRVFDTEDALKEHDTIHNRTPKHQCPHCNYSGHIKWHLDNHMIKEHSDLEPELDKQLKCTFGNCQKIFPTEALLKQHCSISHKSEFKNESKLKSKSETETKTDIQASGQKVKTKPGKGTTLQCDLCDHKPKFAKRAYLVSHMDKHKENPSFKCKYCSKPFWHKSTFNSHICNKMPPEKRNKKQKPKREKKTYECTKCGRHFSSYTNHKHHMLAHDGKFQYKCNVCDKEFNNQIHYESHMDRHYKVKRFKCEFCEHRTVSKADMKQHMRQHTGVKPFKCKYCDKLFTHNSNRNSHEKTHDKKHVEQKQQQVEREGQQIMDPQQTLQLNDQPDRYVEQKQQPEPLQRHQQEHVEEHMQEGETHMQHVQTQQNKNQMQQVHLQLFHDQGQMHQEHQLPQQQLRMIEGGLWRFVPEDMQSGQDQWTVQRQHEIARTQREQCIALGQPMVQTQPHQHHVEHQQTLQSNDQPERYVEQKQQPEPLQRRQQQHLEEHMQEGETHMQHVQTQQNKNLMHQVHLPLFHDQGQMHQEQQLPQQQLRMIEDGLRRFVPENMQSGQEQWTVQRQHEIAKTQREQCIALGQPMVQTQPHQHHVEHQQTLQSNNHLLSEMHVKQEKVQMHKPQQLEQQQHTSLLQRLFDEQSLPEMYGKPEQFQMHQQQQEHINIRPTQQGHHHHVEHQQALQSNNELLPAIHVKQEQQPEQPQMHQQQLQVLQQQQEHINIRSTQQNHHHHVEHQQALQLNNALLPAIHVKQQQQEHINIRSTQQGHHHVEHQQALQSNNPLLPAIHVQQQQQEHINIRPMQQGHHHHDIVEHQQTLQSNNQLLPGIHMKHEQQPEQPQMHQQQLQMHQQQQEHINIQPTHQGHHHHVEHQQTLQSNNQLLPAIHVKQEQKPEQPQMHQQQLQVLQQQQEHINIRSTQQGHHHHVEHQQALQSNNPLLPAIHVKQQHQLEQAQLHQQRYLEQQEHTNFMQDRLDKQLLSEKYVKQKPQPEQLQMQQEQKDYMNLLTDDQHMHKEEKNIPHAQMQQNWHQLQPEQVLHDQQPMPQDTVQGQQYIPQDQQQTEQAPQQNLQTQQEMTFASLQQLEDAFGL